MSFGTTNPVPYATDGASTRQVLDGVLVQQGTDWYLRVDGSSSLWGPVQHTGSAKAGDTVCCAVSQEGALYIVWPAGGSSGGDGSGNIDGGKPDSVYGGLPLIDGNGVNRS